MIGRIGPIVDLSSTTALLVSLRFARGPLGPGATMYSLQGVLREHFPKLGSRGFIPVAVWCAEFPEQETYPNSRTFLVLLLILWSRVLSCDFPLVTASSVAPWLIPEYSMGPCLLGYYVYFCTTASFTSFFLEGSLGPDFLILWCLCFSSLCLLSLLSDAFLCVFIQCCAV